MRQPKRQIRQRPVVKPITTVQVGPDWRIDFDPNAREYSAFSTLGNSDNLLGVERTEAQARQRISDYILAGAR